MILTKSFPPFPRDRSTDDEFRGDVPEPDTGGLKEAFREAYIEVLLLPAAYHQNKVAWHHNFRTSDSDIVNSVCDTTSAIGV